MDSKGSAGAVFADSAFPRTGILSPTVTSLMERALRLLGTGGAGRGQMLGGFVDSLLQMFENCRPGLSDETLRKGPEGVERFFRTSTRRSAGVSRRRSSSSSNTSLPATGRSSSRSGRAIRRSWSPLTCASPAGSRRVSETTSISRRSRCMASSAWASRWREWRSGPSPSGRHSSRCGRRSGCFPSPWPGSIPGHPALPVCAATRPT